VRPLAQAGTMSMPGMGGHPAAMGATGASWLPLLLLLVGPAAAGYALGVKRLTARGDVWPVSRCLAAGAGYAVLAAALLPPLGTDMNFSVHVSQHLVLAMLAPLLLALSAPVTLALRTLPPAGRRWLLRVLHSRAARVFTFAPLIVVLDVGGMYGYYLSPLFAATHAHPWLQLAVHTHMFLAGCLLSWYLVGRDPMPRRASARTARTTLIVLVIAAGSHDLLSKLMYAHLLPHGGGTPAQLRAGAQLMFYGGDAIEIGLGIAVMSAWYARGGRQLTHARRRASPVTVE
jgi:putative membrane protein